jgi:hypothetical protein
LAKIKESGEADHDIKAPAEHHIDQDLDAEIIDPSHRAAEAHREHDYHGVDDHEGNGERDKPVAQHISGGC